MTTRAPFVVTIIASAAKLSAGYEEALIEYLEDHNIEVSGTKELSGRAKDIFLTGPTDLDLSEVREAVARFEKQGVANGIDLVVQRNDEFRKNKKLVVFDMDSTLIEQEVIELIAAYAGVEKKVAEITHRAMNNEIDFAESLRERVALLKGIKVANLYQEISSKLKVTEGVRDFVQCLKAIGSKTAVLSGGFTPFANFIKDNLELDFAKANFLATETDSNGDTVLNGYTEGDIVDGECKARTLKALATELNIPIEATLMVGDGGNDLPAMNVAGFGIAWNAKPKVQQAAPAKLNTTSMRDALYILGFSEEDISHCHRL
ncbi:phosphoserine phosphatase Ecym_7387 [Eremothecium cymbalariae DBVPG|uniref:phosphoserine phosphatase n=1 Tax=Eremothecium cymbalariae (strain CBS 270.75 / DBVPG 7215 / KCTC 17166 / NRRL Y-17582) TaxID=931890 RepID=G8JWJ8_ERECY|nr:hypothetical protein Ecym_7387 [Eremothecium cymbalariae DBVPG\